MENQASRAQGASRKHENRKNSRVGEPPSRPAESSASADLPPREESDDADMGDPRETGGDPESCLERKEKQGESGSMSLISN